MLDRGRGLTCSGCPPASTLRCRFECMRPSARFPPVRRSSKKTPRTRAYSTHRAARLVMKAEARQFQCRIAHTRACRRSARHAPKGRKVFLVLYRTGGAGSRLRKYTIGPYGRVTLHQARLAAQKVFSAKVEGRDLAAEKREARRRIVADQVEDLLETFIAQHVSQRWRIRGGEDGTRRLAHRGMEATNREAIRRRRLRGVAQTMDCRKEFAWISRNRRLARDFERYPTPGQILWGNST